MVRSQKLSVRTAAAAALAAILFVWPSGALATRNAALAAIGIDNFGQINDTYYRGSQPRGEDYGKLASAGIKIVIDLQQDFAEQKFAQTEERDVTGAGMRFHRIPMTTHTPPTPAQLDEFMRIVTDPVNQPVYVHCKGGKHRTGVMTAVYRMVMDGWTADRAYSEMKDYRFGSSFLHPEFKAFVYRYQADLAAGRAVRPTPVVALGGTH